MYVCAGEKDADTAVDLGFCATTNSGGEAAKWVNDSGVENWVKPLTGKSVVVVPDNDEAGRKHALHLLEILAPICRSVKILYVPSDFKDLTLWVESGANREDILAARQALDYIAKAKPSEALPNAEHSEALVLGAVLSGRIPFTEIDHLVSDDFYTHSRIFAACSEVYAETATCESHLVAQKLDDRGILLECGGASKLVELCEDIPGEFSAETHLAAILERSEARRLIGRLEAARQRLMLNGGTPSEVLDEIIEYSKMAGSGAVKIKDLEDLIPDIEQFMKPRPLGFTCGPLKPFMQAFNGLDGKSGKLIAVAGLPGGGKSSLVGQIVGWMVTQHEVETEVISLEIPWEDCLKKICCQLARVPYMAFVTGQASPEQLGRVKRMLHMVMQKKCLRIDSGSGWTIGKLRAHIKQRSRTKKPVKLLVIDYLQLLPFSAKHRADLALNEITKGLKSIGNEFGVDIILLCQMTKENGKENREPENRDLKDVGAGDPDVISFVHTLEDDEDSHFRRIAILVKKNRNGPLVRRECIFFKPYTLFVDIHYREYAEKVKKYLSEIRGDEY